jgi:hypothetical protein
VRRSQRECQIKMAARRSKLVQTFERGNLPAPRPKSREIFKSKDLELEFRRTSIPIAAFRHAGGTASLDKSRMLM